MAAAAQQIQLEIYPFRTVSREEWAKSQVYFYQQIQNSNLSFSYCEQSEQEVKSIFVTFTLESRHLLLNPLSENIARIANAVHCHS